MCSRKPGKMLHNRAAMAPRAAVDSATACDLTTSMRCPTLADLAPPPPGKTGWPWTVETPHLPNRMPDGRCWPPISIVTPAYNQGRFIEETIRSILLQGYPNLEYIIMDGGSTDGTLDVIRRYERWLTYWASETDRGQAHAINKGFHLCTGDVFQWINSDDVLVRGALEQVASVAAGHDLVAGAVIYFGGIKETAYANESLSAATLITEAGFQQPGLWMKRTHFADLGNLPEAYHYLFDRAYLIRYLAKWPNVVYLDSPLVNFRVHEQSKSHAPGNLHQQRRVKEFRQILDDLSEGELGQDLAFLATRRRAKLDWHCFLENCMSRPPENKLLTVREVIRGALRHPRERISRPTIGALRRIIFSQLVKEAR